MIYHVSTFFTKQSNKTRASQLAYWFCGIPYNSVHQDAVTGAGKEEDMTLASPTSLMKSD